MTKDEIISDETAKRKIRRTRLLYTAGVLLIALVMRFFFSPSTTDWYGVLAAYGLIMAESYFEYHFEGLHRKLTRIEDKLNATQ